MLLKKNCYLCKNLIFVGSTIHGDYYCTVTNEKYIKESSEFECYCFCQEDEE